MRSRQIAVVLLCAMLGAPLVARQDAPPPIIEAKPVDVTAAISAVTLYPGRAAVTRSAGVNLQAGAYDLRFANLPETIQPDSLQARAPDGLRVLSVDFVQSAVADAAMSPEVAQLDKQIAALTAALRELTDQREVIKSQDDFLAALTIRTTSDAASAGGTQHLDLDTVKKQMDFITTERQRLQTERRTLDDKQPRTERELAAAKANRDAAAGRAGTMRTAVVGVIAVQPFKGNVTLTYLVSSAAWEAVYNVRAAGDLSSAQIEYDALLTQKTGEDWDDVRLTLSTAQPTISANPPVLSPFYVDISRPQPPAAAAEGDRAGRLEAELARRSESYRKDKAEEKALAEMASDALVAGGGPSVTFELPRAVTVKTNAARQQRTRIGTIDTGAQFVHVATPLLGESVYLRGDLSNSSAYQLLPGRTSIFLGQDFVGPTIMPSVAPNGQFQMHFGIDHAVKVKRQLLSKTTENTGLLSGGRRTSYEYHISVDNGSGHDITLELWDRVPVSRSEEIQVQLVNVNPKLASDGYYTSEQQPLGLLKWWLTIAASSRDRSPAMITWGVRVDRAKDVQMTPLPE